MLTQFAYFGMNQDKRSFYSAECTDYHNFLNKLLAFYFVSRDHWFLTVSM